MRPLDFLGRIKVKLGIVIVLAVGTAFVVNEVGLNAGASREVRIAVASVLALIMVQVMAHGMTKPLRQLASAAQTIAKGRYTLRVRTTSRDEVGELARAFNAMAADLGEVDRQRRELVANVSHELRTPITALRAVLENVVDGVSAADPVTMGTALAQTERLGRLVAQLLDLSRLDSGVRHLEAEPVALEALLDQAAREAAIARDDVTIRPVCAPGLVVRADPDLLAQVLANLLDNAVRHSPPAGLVTLSAAGHGRGVRLMVADGGPGIPETARTRVFERFSRLDAARAADAGGSGLGLAIVKEIVELHGGAIRIDGGAGCRMVVDLPERITMEPDMARLGIAPEGAKPSPRDREAPSAEERPAEPLADAPAPDLGPVPVPASAPDTVAAPPGLAAPGPGASAGSGVSAGSGAFAGPGAADLAAVPVAVPAVDLAVGPAAGPLPDAVPAVPAVPAAASVAVPTAVSAAASADVPASASVAAAASGSSAVSTAAAVADGLATGPAPGPATGVASGPAARPGVAWPGEAPPPRPVRGVGSTVLWTVIGLTTGFLIGLFLAFFIGIFFGSAAGILVMLVVSAAGAAVGSAIGSVRAQSAPHTAPVTAVAPGRPGAPGVLGVSEGPGHGGPGGHGGPAPWGPGGHGNLGGPAGHGNLGSPVGPGSASFGGPPNLGGPASFDGPVGRVPASLEGPAGRGAASFGGPAGPGPAGPGPAGPGSVGPGGSRGPGDPASGAFGGPVGPGGPSFPQGPRPPAPPYVPPPLFPRPELPDTPRWLLPAAFGVGVFAAVALPDAQAGLGIALVALVLGAAAMPAVLRRATPWTVAYGLLSFALVAMVTVRDADWLLPLLLATAGGLGAIAVSGAGRGWLALIRGGISVALAVFPVPWFLAGPLKTLTVRRRVMPQVAALAITAVLLAVFGLLFASADKVFASFLDRLFTAPDWVGTLPLRVFVFAVFAVLMSATVLVAMRPVADPVSPSFRTRLNRSLWVVPLTGLNLLFAAFVAVQVTALFGSNAWLLRTTGLTYADYARQGFFQLMIVSVFVLAIVAVASSVVRAERGDRWALGILLGVLCAFTLVILVSAMHRLDLYTDAYGLSRLRASVAATIWWLGAVFAVVLVAGGVRLAGGRSAWLPRTIVMITGIGVLAFAVWNPDLRVAETQVEVRGVERIDQDYVGDLGAEAVPALDRLPEPLRSCVLADVVRVNGLAEPDPWNGWNLARAEARDLLARHPVLPATACAARSGRY
ncbi:DUF4153 domain-containing protein [Nonomuraea sp. NPDC003754]